jgi:hypothetical protein
MTTFEQREIARGSSVGTIAIFLIVLCALIGSLVVLLAPPTW